MRRVKELDSIRGLAALAIVVYHLWFIQIGLLGAAVDLFFVLSGFLITSILLSNPMSPRLLAAFYARRGLRIWPIYYLSLVVLVLVNPFTAQSGALDGFFYYAVFFQNVNYYWSDSAPAFIPAFRHTWSLAIEEQFYLFWPWLLWVVGRRGIPWLSTALIGLAIMTRGLQFNQWILVTHCDGLVLGALLADVFKAPAPGQPAKSSTYPFLAIGLGAAAFWAGGALALKLAPEWWRESGFAQVQSLRLFSLNLAFFASVGLLTRHAGHPRLAVLRHPWLVYLGQISYGLYLYHHIVFMLWDDYAASGGLSQHLGYDLVKAALSFAIAALSWRYVERPILALKDRFHYRGETSSAVATADAQPLPHGAVLAGPARGGSPRPDVALS